MCAGNQWGPVHEAQQPVLCHICAPLWAHLSPYGPPGVQNADPRAPRAVFHTPMTHLTMFITWPNTPGHFPKRPLFSVTGTPKTVTGIAGLILNGGV